MDDLIFRKAAIEACNQQTTDCNPDHFNGHEHFTEFLDDATIGSFGKWQFANGFNVGVMAARIAIKNIDPAVGPVIEALAGMPADVIAIALAYAKHMVNDGVDVCEKWETATQQQAAFDAAYRRGRYDEWKRWANKEE